MDAGNELANANDIYAGLHYASGVANTKSGSDRYR